MRKVALLLAPWLLLLSTAAAFRQLSARLGPKRGYLGGFLFYWIFWCLLFPRWVLGPRRLPTLFKPSVAPLRRPTRSDVLLLAVPPAVGFSSAFPRALARADKKIVLASALQALINASAEELLWRGTYQAMFSRNIVLGYLYPSVGFAVWHYAPQVVFPSRYPGGRTSFVLSAGLFGLLWGRVASHNGSIAWSTISHVLLDFSGLGARIYFEDA
jgi:membrane protease YdiL (CAAX protease family)